MTVPEAFEDLAELVNFLRPEWDTYAGYGGIFTLADDLGSSVQINGVAPERGANQVWILDVSAGDEGTWDLETMGIEMGLEDENGQPLRMGADPDEVAEAYIIKVESLYEAIGNGVDPILY